MGAVTAETLLNALSDSKRVLLTGPVEPDGDSVGACLALARVLGGQVDVAGVPGWRYAWMPGASAMLADDQVDPAAYDAVIVLDGDRFRLLPNVLAAFQAARIRGIVDHHQSTTPEGYTDWWLEPHATSTCEMIYDGIVALGLPIDRDLATLLYVGTIFDTGGFRYSNTTPATHRMAARLLECGVDHTWINARVLIERRANGMKAAAHVYSNAQVSLGGQLVVGEIRWSTWQELGLGGGDLEGIVDALVHLEGAECGVLLTEKADGTTKASLRSRGRINVAEVATGLSKTGGGHAKAAGASIPEPMDRVRERLSELVAAKLGA